MTLIKRMQRYIEKSKLPENARYEIRIAEVSELHMLSVEMPIMAVNLAFDYGRAKGYRMAKAEVAD